MNWSKLVLLGSWFLVVLFLIMFFSLTGGFGGVSKSPVWEGNEDEVSSLEDSGEDLSVFSEVPSSDGVIKRVDGKTVLVEYNDREDIQTEIDGIVVLPESWEDSESECKQRVFKDYRDYVGSSVIGKKVQVWPLVVNKNDEVESSVISYNEGALISSDLIRNGFAYIDIDEIDDSDDGFSYVETDVKYSDSGGFVELQDSARENNRGIWSCIDSYPE